MNEDKNVILIIDEAQNLTPSVLEEVRMLSNLETDTEKLIQIVLLGQPQLRDKLKLSSLEQFKQRIAIHYHLFPLTKEETASYVNHRLKVASGNGAPELFNPDALGLIYNFSKGTPRLINYACDNALLSGFVYEKKLIDKELMVEAISESHLNLKEEREIAKTFCCSFCKDFNTCSIKWDRAQKGEEQICCEICTKYSLCH
jgi:general secretion pathway protein A